MIKTFEVQLLPTDTQVEQLKQHCGAVRWLWNQLLEANIKRYESEQKFIFRFEMQRMLPQLKKEHEWLKQINSQSLQEQCINLNNALSRKVVKKKAVGFPKFKAKHLGTDSFVVPQFFHICNRSIKLPKIGRIKYNRQRALQGKAKRIIVKQIQDKWFAFISCEIPDVTKKTSFVESEVVGIDVGIKDFAVLSDGTKIANPKHLEKSENILKSRQRKLSKKVKGSNNRNKAREKVAKLHRHISNQRKDFQWKLANSITKNYSVVCMENLNIKGMKRNHNMAKSISSAGWFAFKQKLKHKTAELGGFAVDVDRFAPSTKMCGSCGTLNNNLTLNDRVWNCDCGVTHDRDINAAQNIRSFGIDEIHRLGTGRIYACGDNSSGYLAANDETMSMKQEQVSPPGDPTYSLDKW